MNLSDYGIPKSSISTILDSFEVDSKNSRPIRKYGVSLGQHCQNWCSRCTTKWQKFAMVFKRLVEIVLVVQAGFEASPSLMKRFQSSIPEPISIVLM